MANRWHKLTKCYVNAQRVSKICYGMNKQSLTGAQLLR
jgi:hypothetical protein